MLTVALVLLPAAIGCTNPYGLSGGSDGHGTLVLSMDSGSQEAARFTIFPELHESDIESYGITLSDGPAADSVTTVESEDGAFPAPLELHDIVPGTWRVTVVGYDGTDPGKANAIVEGTQEAVEIRSGGSTEVDSIVLSYLDDGTAPGFFDFTVTWPADEPVDRVVFVLEEKQDGDVASIDDSDDDALEVDAGAGTATKSIDPSTLQADEDDRYAATFLEDDNTLAAGWYWITVRFDREEDDDNPGASTWVADEIVSVRPNLTSSATIDVDEIPLEVRIADEVEEDIETSIEDDDAFDSDDLGFTYEGTGGGTLTIDTSDIEHTIDLSFKIRDDGVEKRNAATDDAAGRFDEETNVEVLFDDNEEPEGIYYPPYPWSGDVSDADVDDLEDTELIPADSEEAEPGYTGPTLEDLNDVIDDGHEDLDVEGEVVLEGDYKGFLQVTFELPDSVDELTFEFGGGNQRQYSFGDFEATLVNDE